MVHRPTDPRSPVQSQRSSGYLPFVIASLAALAIWGWRNSEPVIEWIEEKFVEEVQQPAPLREAEPGDMRTEDRTVESPQQVAERPLSASRRARANLAAYFSTDDYPIAAIRREEQGTVRFRLSISPQGRVARCEIAQSSGSAALDRATCTILTSRAHFEAATDASGEPIADEYVGRIRWELPEG